jgi:hypothetical protein
MRGHAHPDPTLCGENVRVSEPGNHQTSAAFAHRLRRMSGRDPHQPHRVATPLELLFDLTFVIAFGILMQMWPVALMW